MISGQNISKNHLDSNDIPLDFQMLLSFERALFGFAFLNSLASTTSFDDDPWYVKSQT